MKLQFVFPAIFKVGSNGEYSIHFPDLPGTNSQGNSLEDALLNAQNSLDTWLDYLLDEGETIPQPSDPSDIHTEPDEFVSLIYSDVVRFRRQHDNRAVKKTLTIPAWMDEKASHLGINFSRVLQDALQEKFDETA